MYFWTLNVLVILEKLFSSYGRWDSHRMKQCYVHTIAKLSCQLMSSSNFRWIKCVPMLTTHTREIKMFNKMFSKQMEMHAFCRMLARNITLGFYLNYMVTARYQVVACWFDSHWKLHSIATSNKSASITGRWWNGILSQYLHFITSVWQFAAKFDSQ